MMHFHDYQDRREDTLLKLAHFRRHKRKTLKKVQGRTTTYPYHKPEEHHLPGKDTTKRISNAIGKAVNYAKAAKVKKVRFCSCLFLSVLLILLLLCTVFHMWSGGFEEDERERKKVKRKSKKENRLKKTKKKNTKLRVTLSFHNFFIPKLTPL